MHNYEITGHPKVKVIIFITVIGGILATWLNQSVDFLEKIVGMPISITLSSVSVTSFLYIMFSKWMWKWSVFTNIFKYPNLNGRFDIIGKSIKKTTGETFNWEGVLSIKQYWDKILISMKSKNSSSESISFNGSVVYHPMKGYELTYSYDNTPNNNMPELHKHIRTCTLSFDEDTNTATGNYYNDMKNRENYGSMELRRINE